MNAKARLCGVGGVYQERKYDMRHVGLLLALVLLLACQGSLKGSTPLDDSAWKLYGIGHGEDSWDMSDEAPVTLVFRRGGGGSDLPYLVGNVGCEDYTADYWMSELRGDRFDFKLVGDFSIAGECPAADRFQHKAEYFSILEKARAGRLKWSPGEGFLTLEAGNEWFVMFREVVAP